MTQTKDRSAVQGSFTLERTYPASPERVYGAFATLEGKQRWFDGPPGWDLIERAFDFRVGGEERLAGRWPSGTVSDFRGRYYDIVPESRIVYAYEMYIDRTKISVSLATIEFKPADAGTTVIISEAGVFLDGYDDAGSRKHGTALLLDRVGESLWGEEGQPAETALPCH